MEYDIHRRRLAHFKARETRAWLLTSIVPASILGERRLGHNPRAEGPTYHLLNLSVTLLRELDNVRPVGGGGVMKTYCRWDDRNL